MLELSCGLPPGPDFAELAALAEELGYARVWIFDSAPLWEDPFVHLALAAPLWLSVFGPRGAAAATEVADGIIGLPHPTLPTATIVSGTVLLPGEDPGSGRVREAIGPWRVVEWHEAYATGGVGAVDAKPGGRDWRAALEGLVPPGERHLLTFEGHVTHLADRDRGLLEHIDVHTMVGDPARVDRQLARLAAAGFAEVIYTPTGQDVRRELRALAAARA